MAATRPLGLLLLACAVAHGAGAADGPSSTLPKTMRAAAIDQGGDSKVLTLHRNGDILAAAHNFSPGGIDAVLALAGGESLERCIDTLRPGGRVAFPNGVTPPQTRPNISPIAYDAVAGVAEFERLNQAIQQTHLQVPIVAEYALVDAAKAQDRLQAGHILGKIVLHISAQ